MAFQMFPYTNTHNLNADWLLETVKAAAQAAASASTAAEQAAAVVDTFSARITALEGDVGTLSNLTTTAKTDLVSAINEIADILDDALDDIGNLSNLTTDAKNNLVAAINEVDSHADDNATAVSALQVDVGNKANLTTTAKNNLVAAINELNSGFGEHDTLIDDLQDAVNRITPLVVTFSGTTAGNNASCDKTWAQILTAIISGGGVKAYYRDGDDNTYELQIAEFRDSISGLYQYIVDMVDPSDSYVSIYCTITSSNQVSVMYNEA